MALSPANPSNVQLAKEADHAVHDLLDLHLQPLIGTEFDQIFNNG